MRPMRSPHDNRVSRKGKSRNYKSLNACDSVGPPPNSAAENSGSRRSGKRTFFRDSFNIDALENSISSSLVETFDSADLLDYK